MKQLLTIFCALFILTQAHAQLTEPDFIFIITNHKTVEDFDKYIREKGFVTDTAREAKQPAGSTKRCYKAASANFPTVTFDANTAVGTIYLTYMAATPGESKRLKEAFLADGFAEAKSMYPNTELYKNPAQANTRLILNPYESSEFNKSYIFEIQKQFPR